MTDTAVSTPDSDPAPRWVQVFPATANTGGAVIAPFDTPTTSTAGVVVVTIHDGTNQEDQ